MDEIFHVRQAQHYCQGDFGVWDPKITTPPGLYLISLALQYTPLAYIMSDRDLCTTEGLRLTNWLLGLLLFWTIFGLVRQLHSTLSAWRTAAGTLTLALFPVSFFFHHMYYTDTGSLLLVLLTYLFSLRRQHCAAGMAGFFALWLRQTNVVWVALVGFSAGISWIRQQHRKIAQPEESLSQSLWQIVSWIIEQSGRREEVAAIFKVLAPYAVVALAFVIFLAANGGIVLGDKAHHQAGMHVPQLFYFYAYTTAMAAPVVLPILIRRSKRWETRHLVLGGLLAVLMAICVSRFTMEHPFLLSDNRHYSFYLWKDIYRRHWSIRYLAIPAYIFSVCAVHRAMRSRVSALWQLALALCTAAVLVPSPLLEFRYFTVPYFFARLHMPLAESRCALSAELCMFVLINAATIWMFLNRPFTWDSEPGSLQRFMW
ncbi:glucosyltransferase [Coemansia guatemalensis]|uniref:Dol-P-Glc:Glc(2)Man(9)GlcNAc(2)-PP-Dol alpha-1,2-glucosyltransferase n=1 Tax=Coemansia guatemalensis TaxID=2761395 RepID=A0A9W8HMM4_9FUNG|nr:glucosyltransferase [Coemansia guatemalensis]